MRVESVSASAEEDDARQRPPDGPAAAHPRSAATTGGMSARRRRHSRPARQQPEAQLVEADRAEDDQAEAGLIPVLADADDDEGIGDHGKERGAEHRADDRYLAAGEERAAEHRRGERREQPVLRRSPASRPRGGSTTRIAAMPARSSAGDMRADRPSGSTGRAEKRAASGLAPVASSCRPGTVNSTTTQTSGAGDHGQDEDVGNAADGAARRCRAAPRRCAGSARCRGRRTSARNRRWRDRG